MPAYLFAEIEITNPEGYAQYTKIVPATIERALEWWNSTEYAKPKAMRRAASNGRLMFLEGV